MTIPPDTAQLLGSVSLFAGVQPRHLTKLAESSREMVFDAGDKIAGEGEAGIAFYLIVSGAVEVTLRGQARAKLGPGDHFGEISVIDGKPRTATVTATEPLTTIMLPRMVFQDLLESDPVVARSLLIELCSRLRSLDDRT